VQMFKDCRDEKEVQSNILQERLILLSPYLSLTDTLSDSLFNTTTGCNKTSHLPSPERDGPDRSLNGSISTGKSPSETGELQPISVTSNQTRASAASTSSSHSTGRRRRSKNPPFLPALTQPNSGRHVIQVMRKDLTRVHPLTQHNIDKAPKAAGFSRLPPRSPIKPH
jgi:hypothetical protein